ncbi:MAG: FxsA family protein [Desulfomonilia bacterium]
MTECELCQTNKCEKIIKSPIFLAFTLIPIAEIYLLVKAGEHIGALDTVAIVVLSAAEILLLAARLHHRCRRHCAAFFQVSIRSKSAPRIRHWRCP